MRPTVFTIDLNMAAKFADFVYCQLMDRPDQSLSLQKLCSLYGTNPHRTRRQQRKCINILNTDERLRVFRRTDGSQQPVAVCLGSVDCTAGDLSNRLNAEYDRRFTVVIVIRCAEAYGLNGLISIAQVGQHWDELAALYACEMGHTNLLQFRPSVVLKRLRHCIHFEGGDEYLTLINMFCQIFVKCKLHNDSIE